MSNEREKALEKRFNKLSGNVSGPTEEIKKKSAMKPSWLIVGAIVILATLVLLFSFINRSSNNPHADAALKYKHAVALVLAEGATPEGKVSIPFATAWAFSPNLFATNAHVVNQARELRNYGMDIFVVLNGTDNERYQVKAFAVHPLFNEQATTESAAIAYDVGVFQIEGNTRSTLPIASSRLLRNVESGTKVASLGFPMENLLGGGVDSNSPVANMQTGIITSVSDFNQSNRGFESNFLIRHNLPITGGSSGSPLFDGKGNVLAIISAGNMDFHLTGVDPTGEPIFARTPSAAMVHFAQRIDLLSGLDRHLQPLVPSAPKNRNGEKTWVTPE